jgi:hypothetical protein
MIYTSNYATAFNQPNAVSISRSAPKNFSGPQIIKLVPRSWAMIKMNDYSRFKTMFLQQLQSINVHKMAKFCENKILLCWEDTSKANNWCHRDIVREWFNKHGYPCEEWQNPYKHVKVEPKKVVVQQMLI